MFEIDRSLDDIIKEKRKMQKEKRGTTKKNAIAKKNDRIGMNKATKKLNYPFRKQNNTGSIPRIQKWKRKSPRTMLMASKIPVGKWRNDMYDGPHRKSRGVSDKMAKAKKAGCLTVSNLDPGVTDSDIEELFSEFGKVNSSSVHYNRSGISLEMADVTFEDSEDALNAVTKYNGVPLDGKPMKIQLIRSNNKVDMGFKIQPFQRNRNAQRSKSISKPSRERSKSPFPAIRRSIYAKERITNKSPLAWNFFRSGTKANRARSGSCPPRTSRARSASLTPRMKRAISVSHTTRRFVATRKANTERRGNKIIRKPLKKVTSKEELDRQLSEYMK